MAKLLKSLFAFSSLISKDFWQCLASASDCSALVLSSNFAEENTAFAGKHKSKPEILTTL